MATFTVFGIDITTGKDKDGDQSETPSFIAPELNDGAVVVEAGPNAGGRFAVTQNFEFAYNNDRDVIIKYRKMAQTMEIDGAIDDIMNEAMVFDQGVPIVEINLDDSEYSDSIKDRVRDEFEVVKTMLNVDKKGDEYFRRWYVDGRLFFHKVVGKDPKEGLADIRYIDALNIKKVVEIQRDKTKDGVEVVTNVLEYYVYQEREAFKKSSSGVVHNTQAIQIYPEAITYAHSGIIDVEKNIVLSHLHKAIKPHNLLTMVEDARVIYTLTRAPERRVFYVDVGNLPKSKAEQYMKGLINKYKNKMTYNSESGEVRDGSKQMSMLEDVWLPRRDGSRGTEVTTLQGGSQMGEMEEVAYFRRKLYEAMKIPTSRLEDNSSAFASRASEITRDELKFARFVDRLRKKFSQIFYDMLKTQLILTQVMTYEDWETFKDEIYFEFNQDSYFSELKEMEILEARLGLLATAEDYVGRYFSKERIHKQILRHTDQDIEEIDEEIKRESGDGTYDNEEEMIQKWDQAGQPDDPFGGEFPGGEEGGEPFPPKAGGDPKPKPQPKPKPNVAANTPQGAPKGNKDAA